MEVTNDWLPQDGLSRTVLFQNSRISLGENSDGTKFNQFFMDSSEVYNRKEIIHFDGNTFINVVGSLYPCFDVLMQPNVEVLFTNNFLTQYSGPFGPIYIYNTGKITMNNNTFANLTDFGFALIGLANVIDVEVTNFDF